MRRRRILRPHSQSADRKSESNPPAFGHAFLSTVGFGAGSGHRSNRKHSNRKHPNRVSECHCDSSAGTEHGKHSGNEQHDARNADTGRIERSGTEQHDDGDRTSGAVDPEAARAAAPLTAIERGLAARRGDKSRTDC